MQGEERGFIDIIGQTEIDCLEYTNFGLTRMAWSGESQLWLDSNGFEWKK
jgi:hypothetical protein